MEYSVVILKPDVFISFDRTESYDFLKKPLGSSDEFIAVVQKYIRWIWCSIIEEREEVLSQSSIELHYNEHKDIPAKFSFLKSYIWSGPSYIMLVWWDNAIVQCRQLIMDIREEYLENPKIARKNMTHASANSWDAQREIEIHFNHII